MPTSFKKFSPESLRLSTWNYNSQGSYFITICTKHKFPYFGTIRNGVMGLNPIGIIVHSEWEKSVDLRPDMRIDLGPFIVMPDHFHAIITIDNNLYNHKKTRETSVFKEAKGAKNKFGPQRKNLPAVIRGFKGAVTRKARVINKGFAWQSSFYDHIIKEPRAYQQIAKYIIDNPVNWNR